MKFFQRQLTCHSPTTCESLEGATKAVKGAGGGDYFPARVRRLRNRFQTQRARRSRSGMICRRFFSRSLRFKISDLRPRRRPRSRATSFEYVGRDKSQPRESNPQPPHYECGALPIEARLAVSVLKRHRGAAPKRKSLASPGWTAKVEGAAGNRTAPIARPLCRTADLPDSAERATAARKKKGPLMRQLHLALLDG